jgi:prolyl oligopeptidase
VADDYRWLEDDVSAETAAWTREQTRYARAYLDRLAWLPRMKARVAELMGGASQFTYAVPSYANGTFFASRRDPALQQPQIIAFRDPNALASARVVIDPNRLDAKGLLAIDWYRPSPDGRFVAASLSSKGSERGDVHIFETETGKRVDAVIPGVQNATAGGDLAWSADGSGFYYTRYPREGERAPGDMLFYQQLWFHRMGAGPSQDRYCLGRDFPRIAEIRVATHPKGFVLASVQNGDGGEFFHYLKAGDRDWTRLTRYSDRVVQMNFRASGDLVAISRLGAPRGKMLLLRGPEFRLDAARVVIPEGTANLENNHYGPITVSAGRERVFVIVQTGGPAELRAYSFNGARVAGPDLLPVSSVRTLVPLGGDDVLFDNSSFFTPTQWRIFRSRTGKTERTALDAPAAVDYSEYEAVREFAVSKDGTNVPVSILRRRGLKLDGSHPMVVTGYGGYGLSQSPGHFPPVRALLENGVVYAVANLRGGGEFGEEWHNQGRLLRKQNVFDDFSAVLKHVVNRGYTAPARLGIVGGSNGGLLVGALLSQHPEQVRAVVGLVGLYDMLRSELSANGAFNVVEFGTVKEKSHFQALYAYSPYHRVRDGVRYPAVLLSAGANDVRVEAMHSRKMAARLQAATASGLPVLLTVDAEAGHGMGTPRAAMVAKLADEFAFLLHELGVPAPQTK